MRILWFTSSPCGYTSNGTGYNGVGWMVAVEQEIKKQPDIELGVCFPMDGHPRHKVVDGVHYYPIRSHRKSIRDKLLDAVMPTHAERDMAVWPQYLEQMQGVVSDFKPDVIEVFGSEVYIQLGALVSGDIPTVLHIQGLLSLYIHVYHPYGVSPMRFILSDWNPLKIYGRFQQWVQWKRSCFREMEILKHVKHVIGRTDWDKAGASILAPQAQYHYGGEMLRKPFYAHHDHVIPERLTIVTTSSGALYKGFDFILKVADILKNIMHIDFEWRVFGNIVPTFFEKTTDVHHEDVNVKLLGVASAEQLCDEICNATLYFQPSYIENSPNSLCEAQILGVTPIATNVGGTSSIVKDGETGILIPSGEPYYAAYQIVKLYQDRALNMKIGENAKVCAKKRHDRNDIITQLLETYRQIMI